jgi:hypothetical protein
VALPETIRKAAKLAEHDLLEQVDWARSAPSGPMRFWRQKVSQSARSRAQALRVRGVVAKSHGATSRSTLSGRATAWSVGTFSGSSISTG